LNTIILVFRSTINVGVDKRIYRKNRALILNAYYNRMSNKIKGGHSEKYPPIIDKKPIKKTGFEPACGKFLPFIRRKLREKFFNPYSKELKAEGCIQKLPLYCYKKHRNIVAVCLQHT